MVPALGRLSWTGSGAAATHEGLRGAAANGLESKRKENHCMQRRPSFGPTATRLNAHSFIAVLSFLSALSPARLGVAAADPAPSVLESGFENGLRDWSHQGEADFAAVTDQPHEGRQCAQLAVRAGVELHWQQLYREFGPVRYGDAFQVTLWVRSQGVADGTGAYAALQFLDAGGQRIGIEHSKLNLGNGAKGWQQLTIEGVAPKGTEKGRVDLILNSHATAWFDEVNVVQTGQRDEWPDLGDAERSLVVRTESVILPTFGGVGFHVFHHTHDIPQTMLDQVVVKRWREVNPSFARLNDRWDWDHEKLDKVAESLLRFRVTGTEVYMTTWGPKDTQPGEDRRAYASREIDNLEYLIREKGCTNVKWYCMTNELSLGKWGSLISDLPKFRDYHQELFDELKRRNLPVGLLATDASPLSYWHSIKWATENMDEITAVYGGHHYLNDNPLGDERFYPWFLSKLQWGVGLAKAKGKDFLLGEFGCKQDGRTVDGVKRDVCIYWDTPAEPMVAIQLCEAALAAINAGVYAMGNWTFMDFPDDYNKAYLNKWGMFKWTGSDCSTRAHYYAYGLLTKFFRGPATEFRVDCSDPYLRAAAVQHHGAKTYSVAVISRYPGEAPFSLTLESAPPTLALRKYVYDPKRVPQNPFGDLQPPVGKVEMANGRLHDRLGPNTLVVYTTAYDEDPPAPMGGVRVERTPDGKPRAGWQPSPEPDFCYYRVYRSPEAQFVPSLANQIASTVATSFIDEKTEAGAPIHYKVLAVDQSGNASPAP